jgi:hypothetical protein
MRDPAAAGPLTWRQTVAPVGSVLCLIHCVGVALLAPFLPATLAAFAHNDALEHWLVGISVALAVWLAWSSRRLVPLSVLLLAGVAVGSTVAGTLCRGEWLQRIGLCCLALAQIGVLIARSRRHRRRATSDASDCCRHC